MEPTNYPVSLTETEKKVLTHTLLGKSLKQIASEMFLSIRTVETHRYQIFEAMNVHSVTEMAGFALRHRMIEPQNLIPRYVGGKPLNAQQRQILLLIAQGNSQKMVADALNISAKNVNNQTESIRKKLGLHETGVHLGVALTHIAYLTGLLKPEPTTDDSHQ